MPDPAAAADIPASTSFNLLGPVTATVAGTAVRLGGPRQVAVLARLLLSPGQVVSMEQLSESVWDGDCPARPDVAIRSYVSNLRRSIEPDRAPGDRRSRIEALAPGYRLLVEPDRIDAHRYEELVGAARRHMGGDDPAATVEALDQARALWRGEPAEGVIETDVIMAFRSRMTELRLVAGELWFEARLALGDHDPILPDLEAAVAERPRRERLTELAMVALYRSGRQADALAACQRLRSQLLDELGIDPGPAIQALEHKILTHDRSLQLAHRPARASSGLISQPAESVPRPPVHPRRPGARTGPGRPGPVGELVGRRHELQLLDGLAADLARGRSATILVTGEPGAGKSALVARAAETLAGNGVAVAWGRCRAVARDHVLWPWAQVLDGLLAEGDDDATLDGLGSLAALVPSLRCLPGGVTPGQPALGPAPVPPGTPAEAAALFPAVAELLRRASNRQPVVVVLEDAHWADEASIELVAFAGAALAEQPVGFVVVWRNTEAEPAPTRRALRDLARLPSMSRIELAGLEPEAIEELVGPPAPGRARLARALHQITDGNPFLVRELTAALAPPTRRLDRDGIDRDQDGGGDGDLEALTAVDRSEIDLVAELLNRAPSTNTQELMVHRVEQAHPAALATLTVGALCPRSFSAEVVAEVTGLALSEAESALDRAHEAGLLAEDGPEARRYRFVHPVGARALMAVVPGPRLARLHAALGHALWRHGADAVDLAFHFARARSTGTSLLASRFALDSVSRATRPDVVTQAEVLARDALVLLEPLTGADGLELELAAFLTQAAHLRGDDADARTAGERAVAVARLAPDPGLVSLAALAATGSSPDPNPLSCPAWIADDRPGPGWRRTLVADTLAAVDPGSLWAEALQLRLARLEGRADARALGRAEPGRPVPAPGPGARVVWRERTLAALAVGGPSADELLALPTPGEGGDGPLDLPPTASAHDRLLMARLTLVAAGPGAAREMLRAEPRHRDHQEGPATLEILDRVLTSATVAAVEGRADGADVEPDRWAHWWADTAPAVAAAVTEQRLWLRWEQGRFDELDELATAAAPLPWQTLAAAEAGRAGQAGEFLDRWPGRERSMEGRPLASICLLTVAAQRVGHRDMAADALEHLTARPDGIATSRAAMVVLGPVCYFAGLAAATLGLTDLATDHLARAGRMAERCGAPPWLVRVLTARAELAAQMHDWSRAEQLLAEAKSLAADTGIGWLDGRLSGRPVRDCLR